MATLKDELKRTVSDYLERYPDEHIRLAKLLDGIKKDKDILSRREWYGHVTASAVILNAKDEVLLIRHKVLGRWQQPGGHLEPEDRSLFDAAVREAAEETAISPAELVELDQLGHKAIDIDIHPIPDNPSKKEPKHYHFDFLFVFRFSGKDHIIQAELGSAWKWANARELDLRNVTRKLKLSGSD